MENRIKRVNCNLEKCHMFWYQNAFVKQLIAIESDTEKINDDIIINTLNNCNITRIEDTYYHLANILNLDIYAIQIQSISKDEMMRVYICNNRLIEYFDNKKNIRYINGHFYNYEDYRILNESEIKEYIKKIGVYNGKRKEY